jgi:hypothetical protein
MLCIISRMCFTLGDCRYVDYIYMVYEAQDRYILQSIQASLSDIKAIESVARLCRVSKAQPLVSFSVTIIPGTHAFQLNLLVSGLSEQMVPKVIDNRRLNVATSNPQT